MSDLTERTERIVAEIKDNFESRRFLHGHRESVIESLEAVVGVHVFETVNRLTAALAEAREALDEALPLLNHLSRETSIDHIGDEWLTPAAQRARNVASRLRALKEKP